MKIKNGYITVKTTFNSYRLEAKSKKQKATK
jgi:hypothetical protein